jgi:hypothetical protein
MSANFLCCAWREGVHNLCSLLKITPTDADYMELLWTKIVKNCAKTIGNVNCMKNIVLN